MNREISRTQFTVSTSPNELSLLPVKINGFGPYTFIFDTGASCCCIATELARKLKIRKRRKVPANGADGSYTAHHGVASTISIGRAVRKNIDVAIFDFSTLRKVMKVSMELLVITFSVDTKSLLTTGKMNYCYVNNLAVVCNNCV